MSIALLITEDWQPDSLLPWTTQVARARQEDILILSVHSGAGADQSGPAKVVKLGPDDSRIRSWLASSLKRLADERVTWVESASPRQDELKGDGSGPPSLFVRQIQGRDAARVVLQQLPEHDVSLLILPRQATDRSTTLSFDLHRRLFRDARCQVMQLRPGHSPAGNCTSILVPAGTGPHTQLCLRLASDVASANDGQVTALYVEPEVDAVAELVGLRILDRIIQQALGGETDRMQKRVKLHDNVAAGIRAERDNHDLVLLGATHHGVVHHILFRGISEQLLTDTEGPAVAVLRAEMPLTSRLQRFVERRVVSRVPQLDRQARIALVERVQSNSQWDFDFIALICLSTLIATLGLIKNSSAVVIGAMLVAPLMTPLLGAGLSLAQGNSRLFCNAARAVLRGFLLALLIAFLVGCVGWLMPGLTLNQEMEDRGQPSTIDLLVAFLSGIAAAYATGRPNLLSALPGVAIAASLVPPIATSGLALSLGRFQLAGGAALLFLTNIIAIVLGATLSLWAVGIRGSHEHGTFQQWALRVALLLAVAAMALGILEAFWK